jgi:hypothetical protein
LPSAFIRETEITRDPLSAFDRPARATEITRDRLPSEFIPETEITRDAPPESDEGKFVRAGRAACCVHGRATRQVPCRNPNFLGCPFRDKELDDARIRERLRGRPRGHRR